MAATDCPWSLCSNREGRALRSLKPTVGTEKGMQRNGLAYALASKHDYQFYGKYAETEGWIQPAPLLSG
jgi:hypothetical protein